MNCNLASSNYYPILYPFYSPRTDQCFVSFESVHDKYSELDEIHSLLKCKSNNNLNIEENKTNHKDKMSVRRLSDGNFRPRGALARSLYRKYQNDCNLREINKFEDPQPSTSSGQISVVSTFPENHHRPHTVCEGNEKIRSQPDGITAWYRCKTSSMGLKAQKHFVQLSPDEDTREFISNSIEKSSWIWTQIWHCLAKSILSFFMTRTDINGWLGRGSMFVLSSDQISHLLKSSDFHKTRQNNEQCTLVDIGAGDGEVTVIWKYLFTKLYATEMSKTMRNLLQTKGFEVLDIETWWKDKKYDVVCMLNLLDRCSEPITMMMNAREAVKDDGLIIVALVLPFKAYVEYEDNHEPSEYLPIAGRTFENQVESFIDFAESNIGLDLVLWSKVPYLCEGDIDQSYYWLNDAIFIFRKNPNIKPYKE